MIPTYDITSPIFDTITIKLDNRYYKGKQFVIKTHNNSAANCYIQRATLNGAVQQKVTFPHEAFANGGELELWLGDQPNKSWGSEKKFRSRRRSADSRLPPGEWQLYE